MCKSMSSNINESSLSEFNWKYSCVGVSLLVSKTLRVVSAS